MLSKGAKRTTFYHITVILQYCWDKTIARSGDMYRDDSGILSLVIKCYGITNTSVQNFAIRISSIKTVPKCLRKLIVFFNKFNIIVVLSLLMSSLRVIVICQKYFGNHVISSQIHHFLLYLTWGVVLCGYAFVNNGYETYICTQTTVCQQLISPISSSHWDLCHINLIRLVFFRILIPMP